MGSSNSRDSSPKPARPATAASPDQNKYPLALSPPRPGSTTPRVQQQTTPSPQGPTAATRQGPTTAPVSQRQSRRVVLLSDDQAVAFAMLTSLRDAYLHETDRERRRAMKQEMRLHLRRLRGEDPSHSLSTSGVRDASLTSPPDPTAAAQRNSRGAVQRVTSPPQVDLSRFPIFPYGGRRSAEVEGDECPICLMAFEVGDPVILFPCAHMFHQQCGQDWISRSACCPMCQGNLLLDSSMAEL